MNINSGQVILGDLISESCNGVNNIILHGEIHHCSLSLLYILYYTFITLLTIASLLTLLTDYAIFYMFLALYLLKLRWY